MIAIPHLKKYLVVGSLGSVLFFFVRCSTGETAPTDPRGSDYAGSAACISCHKDVADHYMHDHHFNASGKVNYADLKSFINDSNKAVHYSTDQTVSLSEKDSGLYQTNEKELQQVRSERMDIAFGSPVKAQTYAYWKDSQLFELPLTFLKDEKIWTNSPGYPIDKPYFTRIIPKRCLECHSSYIRAIDRRDPAVLRVKQVFTPETLVYGIDCERCHGPAAKHAAFQQEHPDVKEARYITSIRSLSRNQQLDLCGTCHSGDPVSKRSIFAFVPGDSLKAFYMYFPGATGEPDVHGMQSQLLKMSRCFRESEMTCNSCHSAHQSVGERSAFVSQCNSCHSQVKHTIDIKQANNDCITCHMPSRPSKSLDFNNQTKSGSIQYMLRTHRIAVYPKEQWK